MSDHPLSQAPNSAKPFLRVSYYDYQEWVSLFDSDKLTKWELLRFKGMYERYFFGRAFVQVPVMGLSWLAAHLVIGPPMRRRGSGFRDNLVFATFFYILFHHWIDQRQVPCHFLDELFTQEEPCGGYLRETTKENFPELWESFRTQLQHKELYS